MTEKKCTKYESLFTFSSEEELKEHLDECEDCRREQEEMDKISELIQEVRPYYFQKRTNSINSFKVACVLFIVRICILRIFWHSKKQHSF